jgi:hypothetical protein
MLPGVGVAIAIAFVPVGVTPLGVIIQGVACRVPWGLWGVPGVCGVIAPGVNWRDGVSYHRLRRLLAEGVGVSWIKSPAPVWSVLGVSAQPLLWPGVPQWRKTQQEHILWNKEQRFCHFKLLRTPREALTAERKLSSSLSYSSTKDKQPTNQHNNSTTLTHNLMHPKHSQINLAKQHQNM